MNKLRAALLSSLLASACQLQTPLGSATPPDGSGLSLGDSDGGAAATVDSGAAPDGGFVLPPSEDDGGFAITDATSVFGTDGPFLAGDCLAGPDQPYVVFDSLVGLNRDLYIVRIDGCHLKRITDRPYAEEQAAFSPDGTKLAYVSDEGGKRQIWIYVNGDPMPRPITNLAAGADQPSWSPDSKLIAFHSGPAVFVMDADGQNVRHVLDGLDDFNAFKNPVFTADGAHLLADRNNQITYFDLMGGQQRNVISNWTTTIESPSVSKSGLYVAYHVDCGTGLQVFVAPLSTETEPCRGPLVADMASDPRFGPDDRIVFVRGYNDHPPNLGVAVVGSGAGLIRLQLNGQHAHPSWVPSGAAVPISAVSVGEP